MALTKNVLRLLFLGLFLVVGILPAGAAFSDTPANRLKAADPAESPTVRTLSVLGGNVKAHWTINTDEKRVFFALEAKTPGYVALGLGEAAAMRGADIAVAHVDADGKAHVADYHAVGNQKPIKDGCQDWTVHFGEEADGNTLVVISRKFTTEDSNDRPILLTGLKQTSLLFAFGAEDTLAYHSNNRVKKKVDLSTGTSGEKDAFVARLESTAGMSYIDLRFNAATAPSEANGINTGGYPNYKVPDAGGREILSNSRTEYWEYCFATSSHPGWSAHAGKALVGFNGILDDGASRSDLVHHSVLYAYSGDNCKNGESIIWVGGVNFYEELPANVGMSFDRFKSFRIQVHYDNPKLETGLKDNSGIRMWLDATAREHEAGTIQLGDPQVQLSASGKTIPPGKSMWEFACPSSVTSNWHKITVFSQILHMHQIGDMMYLEVKDSNGVVKRPNAVEYFDFAWQDPTLVEPFEIKPGDELITRCYFNNQGNTPVPFGQGSDEEMCIDFIFYYPYLESNKNALAPTQYCGFQTSGEFKNDTVLDTNDDGMRIFGINAGAADDPKCDTQKATTEWTNPSVAASPSSAGAETASTENTTEWTNPSVVTSPSSAGVETVSTENGASTQATGLWVVLIASVSVALRALL